MKLMFWKSRKAQQEEFERKMREQQATTAKLMQHIEMLKALKEQERERREIHERNMRFYNDIEKLLPNKK